jgi:CRISPR-associated protein Cas2
MLLVSYDITNDKTRTKFSKFLSKFGRRMQYSVFEIRNSERVLKNIIAEVENRHKKQFKGSDSIVIFQICEGCKKRALKFGYAKTEDSDIVFV